SGAGDNRDSARDNAVGAEHADVEIGDMHRATLAFAVAGLPAVKLRHHAVEIGTLGDAMAMASMRRDDPVVALKGAANADRDRLPCRYANAARRRTSRGGSPPGPAPQSAGSPASGAASRAACQVADWARGSSWLSPPVRTSHEGRGGVCWHPARPPR